MLSKIISSKDVHSQIIVSANWSTDRLPEIDQGFFEVPDWHEPVFNSNQYNVSLPQDSKIVKAIRESGFFAINFFDKNTFNSIVPNLTGQDKTINQFNLQIFESQKIKNPVIANALAHAEFELHKELQIGENVLFTGKLVNSYFNK